MAKVVDTYCYTVFSGDRSSWPHRGRRTCWTHAPGLTPETVWELWLHPRLGTPSGHPAHVRPGPVTPPSDCHTGPPYHRWATRASALQLEGQGTHSSRMLWHITLSIGLTNDLDGKKVVFPSHLKDTELLHYDSDAKECHTQALNFGQNNLCHHLKPQ